MAVSWTTIKSLLLFFGPVLAPRAIRYYRSARSAPAVKGIPVRPAPPAVKRSLVILLITASLFLFRTLPVFAPENIFKLTQSRLQIPNDVLFTRLNALRPGHTGLTEPDNLLRSKITSLESRLLFFQFGPNVLTYCQYCNSDDQRSYLFYAIPSLLAPHLFNLCALGLVTSGMFTGKEGGIWRTKATLAACAVACVDLYVTATYKYQSNARATRLEDLYPFHWKMRVYRLVGLALLDIVLGWLLYLSSTNRAFVTPVPPIERVEATTKMLENVRGKMNAVSILRNTINRDEVLRERSRGYWVTEGRLMGELMQEREVVDGVHNALENRINMKTIAADAEAYAQNVLGPMQEVTGT